MTNIDLERILSLVDLTSLNTSDNETVIKQLCQQAITAHGHVAAVCVLPQFVKLAKELLHNTPVKIATVSNFPLGNESQARINTEIELAKQNGADEIDIVIPYQAYLAGDNTIVEKFTQHCKVQCGSTLTLKMILETGALGDDRKIAHASVQAIAGGADFIKTSTGKHAINATLNAAEIMLRAIKNYAMPTSDRAVGFKAAGGIQTIKQALEYIQLAEKILGSDWVNAKTFRLGTSRLLEDIRFHQPKHNEPSS
jgi:deoxyribose-phosphate aldolase